MVAIILLLTTTSIAAYTYDRISRIIHHKVTHITLRRMTMERSTPNEKTDSEVAKQALTDYIASIRLKMLSYCHPYLTAINYSNRIIVTVNRSGEGTWKGLIWDKSIYKYSVTIDTSEIGNTFIGFAPSKLYDLEGHNYGSCGWYLYLKDGTLFSQNGEYRKAYSRECKVGDTISCIYSSSCSEISFEKNGVTLGVAYTNVNGEDIAPAVELHHVGDSITLSANINQLLQVF
jgi:SPRY domain